MHEREPQPDRSAVRHRRRMVALGLLRAAATSLFLLALYYVLPLDQSSLWFLVVVLVAGLVGFVATSVWEVHAIVRSPAPALRAIQALAVLVPFFLLLFSSIYFAISLQSPETFSEPLSRSDALYFTVSTFATVGFGDITPDVRSTRLLVSGQILLDLVILGLGIRVIIGAVKKGLAT